MATIKVEGLSELNSSLRKVQSDYPNEMKAIHLEIAQPIAADAKVRVRSRSGRLAGSIRPLAGQRYARIKAGRKGLDRKTGYDYSRINHFGRPGWYEGNEYIYDALDAGAENALNTYLARTEKFLDRVWSSF